MEKIDWKSYPVSIKLSKNSAVYKILDQKFKEAKECIVHEFNIKLFHGPVRRYRRGKNRCKRCGYKIK